MDSLEEEVETKIGELDEEVAEIQEKMVEPLRDITVERRGNTEHWSPGDSAGELFGILGEYEVWYNKALPLIVDYLPDREDEFRSRYDDVRKTLEINLDYIDAKDISTSSDLANRAIKAVAFQAQLISSISGRVESETYKATERVSNDIVSNEVQKAKELFDEGNIRAAGVIAGVAIERHLLTICESSPQELDFGYMDGITSLSQTLSNADEISDDDERLLEYLAGIRNKCSHASQDEPEKRDVERMLEETDEFLTA